MKPPLGDVVVRARGLGLHLLPRQTLERLARSAGSGVLVGAMEAAGYWSAPATGGVAQTAAEAIDTAIHHEFGRRLALLARWLGERRSLFCAVFEDEDRRAIRIRLRWLAAGGGAERSPADRFGLPRRLREGLSRARDVPELIRALAHNGSPYAEPMSAALRAQGEDTFALERALDSEFARRARRAAERLGGSLLRWVCDGIDLENAWDALLADAGGFVPGGRRLASDQHAAIAREPDERTRRRRLSEIFARGALAAGFDDPRAPLADLEARVAAARIRELHGAARVDPLGAPPILLVVSRLRAERADLRCINWGIAQGVSPDAILARTLGAR
jgi:hypothetical protein